MGRRVLREMLVYAGLIVMMSLLMHPDLFTAPCERFERMRTAGTYAHPFLYAGGVYLLFSLLRGIWHLLRSLFSKTA